MAALVGSQITTLGSAWREFWGKRAPKVIALAIGLALAVRVALGDWSWRDVAAIAFMLVVYPFGEWAIHVHLLHLRPFKLRGRRIALPTARAHREHHEAPHRLDLINFSPREALAILGLAVPTAVGLGAALAALVPGPLAVQPP